MYKLLVYLVFQNQTHLVFVEVSFSKTDLKNRKSDKSLIM